MRARLGLCLVVAALASAGAGLAAQPPYRVNAVPGYGISLSLPVPWKAVDSAHVLTAAQAAALDRDNPELAGALSEISKPNSPIKFFAFDPMTRLAFATNVNVVVVPIPGRVSFDTYAKALVGEVTGLSTVSRLSSKRVKLPAGQAVRVSYRIRFVAGGKTRQAATLQYAFLRNGTQSVVFTYTTLPELQTLYSRVFAASASSIRFGR